MKTVIEMAREVYGENTSWAGPQLERLERFADLIRADAIAEEREACGRTRAQAILSLKERSNS